MISEVRPIAWRSIAARAESVIFELALAIVYARDAGEGVVLGFRLKTVHGHLPGALSSLALVHFGAAIDVIAGRPILDGHVNALTARLVATVCRAGVVVITCIHHAFAFTVLTTVQGRAGVSIVARAGVVGSTVIWHRDVLALAQVAGVGGARVVVVAVGCALRDRHFLRHVRGDVSIVAVLLGGFSLTGDVLLVAAKAAAIVVGGVDAVDLLRDLTAVTGPSGVSSEDRVVGRQIACATQQTQQRNDDGESVEVLHGLLLLSVVVVFSSNSWRA